MNVATAISTTGTIAGAKSTARSVPHSTPSFRCKAKLAIVPTINAIVLLSTPTLRETPNAASHCGELRNSRYQVRLHSWGGNSM
jgi:hypothetical protein